MEKLTKILAVVERADAVVPVLDKAITIARQFRAHLHVMASYDLTQLVTARCAKYEHADLSLNAVHRGEESWHVMIMRRVLANQPDLVVKAPAGANPLRRWTLDDNDWALANQCPAALLLARPQQWGSPVSFAAAVDVSHEDHPLARSILHTAGFFVLGFHGDLDILYSEREKHDDALRMERAVRLAQLVREYHVGCGRIRRLEGDPEDTLASHAEHRRYDVLVLGAPSRRQGLASVLPGTASRLIEATLGDALLVKTPQAKSGDSEEPRSLRQQRAYQLEELA